jgi:NTP pyrophosphatase (non-canonical NTP hydrolase)
MSKADNFGSVSVVIPNDELVQQTLTLNRMELSNPRNDEAMTINELSIICRRAADTWYYDPISGTRITHNVGEHCMLMVSEISEAFEARRKNKMDDHLPHRRGVEVELADAMIRILDFAGENGLDIGGAFWEKIGYNLSRQDHKPEQRRLPGGKQF